MSDPVDPLVGLAVAVSDGADVDWDAAESSAGSDAERSAVRQLRLLTRIAQLRYDAAQPVHETIADERDLRVWGRLQILERVGHGSFGEVYRAWDPHLDREVALKLQRPDPDGVPARSASQIVEEGRLLARVRHPNVVIVYGAERLAGRVGVWTEFIRGRTLARTLLEHGPYSATEAAVVGLDLCRALSAVHRAGLVHRDVKSENVMREAGGRTVLMDFGAGADVSDDSQQLAGTPLYLAPELFQHAPATPQSDIYSLGVLLFHLVTGDYPVVGRTVRDLREAHVAGRRRLLRDLRPDLPLPFIAAVEQALDRDPEHRHPTAGAFESALRAVVEISDPHGAPPDAGTERPAVAQRRTVWRLPVWGSVAAAVVVLVLSGNLALPVKWGTHEAATGTFRSGDWLLVADFQNRTGDPGLDGALEHALAYELDRSAYLNVVSRLRIMDTLLLMRRAADTRLDAATAREVALRDGGVRGVLTGRVDRVPGVYLLTVDLVDVATGATVDVLRDEARGDGELMASVGRMAVRVGRSLGESRPAAGARPLQKVTTPSLRALALYSQALSIFERPNWQFGGTSLTDTWLRRLKTAETLLQEAVAQDPGFAMAHVWLARVKYLQWRPPAEWLPDAERAHRLAAEATERERYFILGTYHQLTGDYDAAIETLYKLLEVNPADRYAASDLATHLLYVGRWRESAAFGRRAADLRPNDFRSNEVAARSLIAGAGDPAAAALYGRRAAAAATPEVVRTHPWAVAWTSFLPAFERWSSGDIAGAAEHVDRVVSTVRGRAGAERYAYAETALNWQLTLGRLRSARELFELMRDDGHGLKRETAPQRGLLEGRRPGLREYMQQVGYGAFQLLPTRTANELAPAALAGPFTMMAAQRIAGGFERALEPERRYHSGFRAMLILLRAEIAREGGRRKEAIVLFQNGLPALRESGRPAFYYGSISLAELLERGGDVEGAARVLEQAAQQQARAYWREPSTAVWPELYWDRVRLLRRAGRVAEAAAVEASLRKLLAHADPDHPILLALGR